MNDTMVLPRQAHLRVGKATAALQQQLADAGAATTAAQQLLEAQQQSAADAERRALEARSRVATLHAQLAQRYVTYMKTSHEL